MNLAEKLLVVQSKIGALTRDSENPFFKSRYADLSQVLKIAKEHLTPLGIVILQGPNLNEHGRYVETTLVNVEDGQSVNCRVPFSGNEKDVQQIGASTTYGRRIGLKSLLAMEEVDDDGESAVGRGQAESRKIIAAGKPAAETPKAPPVEKKAGSGLQETPRKTINEKISLTSKVLVDSKRATQEDVVKMLTAYGVKTKEDLTDDQARKLLTQLEDKLKGNGK